MHSTRGAAQVWMSARSMMITYLRITEYSDTLVKATVNQLFCFYYVLYPYFYLSNNELYCWFIIIMINN